MPKQYSRSRRVADLIQRELAGSLQREMIEPRFGLITISAVDVSPDLKNARVFVTTLGSDEMHGQLLETLNASAGHYRHLLAGVLELRSVPRLSFVYDESIQRGRHMSDLIDSLQATSENNDGLPGSGNNQAGKISRS